MSIKKGNRRRGTAVVRARHRLWTVLMKPNKLIDSLVSAYSEWPLAGPLRTAQLLEIDIDNMILRALSATLPRHVTVQGRLRVDP